MLKVNNQVIIMRSKFYIIYRKCKTSNLQPPTFCHCKKAPRFISIAVNLHCQKVFPSNELKNRQVSFKINFMCYCQLKEKKFSYEKRKDIQLSHQACTPPMFRKVFGISVNVSKFGNIYLHMLTDILVLLLRLLYKIHQNPYTFIAQLVMQQFHLNSLFQS